jgi:hypothetical protein
MSAPYDCALAIKALETPGNEIANNSMTEGL